MVVPNFFFTGVSDCAIIVAMTDQQSTPETTTPLSTQAYLGIVFSLVFAIVAFFSGVSVGTNNGMQTANIFSFFQSDPDVVVAEEYPELDEFWRVWDLMEDKFAHATTSDSVSDDERVHGAIQGLVNSYGDSYSVYLPPQDAETFGEDISGNFSGVGMEVGMRNGMITIISPLPDTPADNAGVLAGDVIAEIDGESTEDMTVDEAVKRIRGEKGTEVVLQIAREGEMSFLEIPIERDKITIPTIETEQRDDIFIISLYSFNALAEAKMQEALREFVSSDAENLVLDLRGNPGGYLQSAIGIASYFLPTGKVVVKESFGDDRPDQLFRSQGRVIGDFNPNNFVVLVNGGSASASEIVAGALAEHDVATLLGTQTFGKGSVQELIDIDSGASLKVTVARWLTPGGTSISNGGLEPEIEVERTPQQRLDGEDPQLDAAIDYLLGRPIENQVTSQW